jgi:FkbM family methyltransferase
MPDIVKLAPQESWTFAPLPEFMREHSIMPSAVAHIGAHHGEEVDIYHECGFKTIYLYEPDPRNLEVLRSRAVNDPTVSIVAAAVTTRSKGPQQLHLAARTVWSGLSPHPTATGDTVVVPTVPMSHLSSLVNVLVLDTQGSEYELLRAADLSLLDLVIVETTRRRGDGAAFYEDAVAYMEDCDWVPAQEWVHDDSGYTDTVFIKNNRQKYLQTKDAA